MSTPNTDQPADADEQQSHPTVASLASVASTTDDLEAEQPTHPDRPVGVNVDTASLGTGVDDSEDPEDGGRDVAAEEGLAEDSDEALGAAQTDAADSRDA